MQPLPDGSHYPHEYPIPDVTCTCGAPMIVERVGVVGGLHSLMFILRCGVCGIHVDVPATDYEPVVVPS